MARERTVEFCRAMLAVARHRVAENLVEYGEDDRRTLDAKESLAGWVRELDKWERHEEEAA